MENMKQIAKAFVEAQKGFSPALKTSTNPHYKSRYADLAACVEAVIDSLNANGIALIQNCHESDSGVIVETIFLHESGETMSAGRLHVPAQKQDPQGYGSALTYARRYSLMASCGIAPEDDDGNASSGTGTGKKAPKKALDDGVVLDHLAAIETASDVDGLREYFEKAIQSANKIGDTAAVKKFIEAKNKRKMALLPDVPQ